MAWTSPATSVAGSVLTAAWLNTYVRDNANLLKTSINDDGSLKTWLDKSTTEQDVNNTNVETSIYSYSVTAGILSTNRALNLRLTGSYLMNVAPGPTLAFKVKFGGTTVLNASSITYGSQSASRAPFWLEVLINNNNSASSQRIVGTLVAGLQQATGGFSATASGNFLSGFYDSLAVDTSSAQTLQVTVQHSSSNSALSFKRYAAVTQLIAW